MPSSDKDELVVRLDAEMASMRGDVATLADIVRDLTTSMNTKFGEFAKQLDRRANMGKQNTLTILLILVPIGIAGAGILWMQIDAAREWQNKHTDKHMQMQFDAGFQAGIHKGIERETETAEMRLQRLEDLIFKGKPKG